MKSLKLAIIFIFVLGAFVVGLSWGGFFGGSNSEQKEMVSEKSEDKEEIVTEKTETNKKSESVVNKTPTAKEKDSSTEKDCTPRTAPDPSPKESNKEEMVKKNKVELEKSSTDEVRQTIVNLIRDGKTLSVIQKVDGYKSLDITDKITIETILRPEQFTYPTAKSSYKKPDKVGQMDVNKAVAKKSTIKTWADLKAIQSEITRIMNKFKK